MRFAGMQNSFTQFKLGKDSTAKLLLVSNSTLRGAITVGSGGIWFEDGARATSGTISSVSGSDLKLYFLGDFVQRRGDATFAADETWWS